MKIKSIKFQNHPILGKFECVFSVDDTVKNFALLVAENGCGKTVFLEEIHKILVGGIALWNDGISREIIFEFTPEEITSMSLPSSITKFVYDGGIKDNWGAIQIFDGDDNDITSVTIAKIQGQNADLNKLLKCAYSTVEINFNKKNVEAIRASTVDTEEVTKNRSNSEIATEIAQLLVDIKNQDNAEKAKHFEGGRSSADTKYSGKFDRFKGAYKKMFDGKELLDVRAENSNHQVIFRDKNKDVEFEIGELSSGEKQIAYRVGYLLKSLRGLSGGIILIDEPELSLHPKWQEKYLQFLRDVFSDASGLNIQFIIATHSPLLLKGVLGEDVSVHILNKDPAGQVIVTNAKEKGFGCLKWSPSWGEICYFAYGMATVEFHDDLYSAIEDSLKVNPEDRVEQTVFERHVLSKEPATQMITWTDGKGSSKSETIMTFVRNKTHHPNNPNRPVYTPEQMKESIEIMLDIIKNP